MPFFVAFKEGDWLAFFAISTAYSQFTSRVKQSEVIYLCTSELK